MPATKTAPKTTQQKTAARRAKEQAADQSAKDAPAVEAAAAKLATPAAKKAKPHGPQGAAYTNRVVCAKRGCKAVRWTKPQDAFQVRFCDEHQKDAAKARRAALAKTKREAAKAEAAS